MKYNFNQLKEIVKSKMSLKRFTHTLGVVEMAGKLADIYKADVEKCKLAALLHDICKEMDMEDIKNICKNNFLNELSDEDLENNEILHGFAGAYYVNKEFGIEDSEVLNAIKYHTIGSKSFYDEKAKILISGDTLFRRSYGRYDLPTGDLNMLCNSLEKLSKLPEEIVVYSGHTEETTIGEEKKFLERVGIL